jgi:hypothetical protein
MRVSPEQYLVSRPQRLYLASICPRDFLRQLGTGCVVCVSDRCMVNYGVGGVCVCGWCVYVVCVVCVCVGVCVSVCGVSMCVRCVCMVSAQCAV